MLRIVDDNNYAFIDLMNVCAIFVGIVHHTACKVFQLMKYMCTQHYHSVNTYI